jgi:hypothetical protein
MNWAILIEFVAITPVEHRANWTSQPHAGPPHPESIHYLSRRTRSAPSTKNAMLRFVARVLIARQHDLCQAGVEAAIHSGVRITSEGRLRSPLPRSTDTFGPKPPSTERVLGDGSSVEHFPELRHVPAPALRSAGCLAIGQDTANAGRRQTAYILAVPKSEHETTAWRVAIETLLV